MSDDPSVPVNLNTGGHEDQENVPENTLPTEPEPTFSWLSAVVARAQPQSRKAREVLTKFKKHLQTETSITQRLNKEQRAVLAEAQQRRAEMEQKKRDARTTSKPPRHPRWKPKVRMPMGEIVTQLITHGKVTPELRETSGYTLGGLSKINAKVQKGFVPSTKTGRRRKCSQHSVAAFHAESETKAINAKEYDAFYDEMCVIEHVAGPHAGKPVDLPSRWSVWRYNREGRMTDKTAQNQTAARKTASEDLWNMILLFVFWLAIRLMYCAKGEVFNDSLMLNIDGSTMKTLDVTNKIKARKGSPPLKLLTQKAKLRQQIGLMMGYTASGCTLTPMLWIRARKGVEVGKPKIYKMTDGRVTNQFLGRHVPVYVIMYHKDDKVTKGALTKLYMDMVVVPSTEELRKHLKPGSPAYSVCVLHCCLVVAECHCVSVLLYCYQVCARAQCGVVTCRREDNYRHGWSGREPQDGRPE